MSYKIKALLSLVPLVLICCGGVHNELGWAAADDVVAEDVALLTHFIQTIDAAADEAVLINVTSTILNNLCACVRDTLNTNELHVGNENENVLIPEAEPSGEDFDRDKSVYNRTCHDQALQHSDAVLSQDGGYIKKCSRFNFVRKFEESFIDNQLKSKFKKIMYDILIKSKDLHKYEIKKYNLYEKPQPFDRNAMRSVIIIITLNLSKSFKAKTDSNAIKLSEIDAALEDKGTIYVDFIDPAYDPKHTIISSAKNVSYCNLKSVLAVLLDSEKKNLTKTFKLIRKGGAIKVYTSLSTNYAYEQYSDICCYKNNTNTFCKTSMKDVDPEGSKLYKDKQTEQINKHKETVSKIKTLIGIYNKKLIRRLKKTDKVRTDKINITNNKNHHYSNLVIDKKNRSTDISEQHLLYQYKKFLTSKINNIPQNEKKTARNSRFLAASHTANDSKLNSQRTTEFMDVTSNEISHTAEAEKIYLKVCNYDMWSNTTVKDFPPYKYIVSNHTVPKNTTFTPIPLQATTEPKLNDNSWTVNPIETYTSNYIGTQVQNAIAEVKRNKSYIGNTLPEVKLQRDETYAGTTIPNAKAEVKLKRNETYKGTKQQNTKVVVKFQQNKTNTETARQITNAKVKFQRNETYEESMHQNKKAVIKLQRYETYAETTQQNAKAEVKLKRDETYAGTTQQNTDAEVKLQRNKTHAGTTQQNTKAEFKLQRNESHARTTQQNTKAEVELLRNKTHAGTMPPNEKAVVRLQINETYAETTQQNTKPEVKFQIIETYAETTQQNTKAAVKLQRDETYAGTTLPNAKAEVKLQQDKTYAESTQQNTEAGVKLQRDKTYAGTMQTNAKAEVKLQRDKTYAGTTLPNAKAEVKLQQDKTYAESTQQNTEAEVKLQRDKTYAGTMQPNAKAEVKLQRDETYAGTTQQNTEAEVKLKRNETYAGTTQQNTKTEVKLQRNETYEGTEQQNIKSEVKLQRNKTHKLTKQQNTKAKVELQRNGNGTTQQNTKDEVKLQQDKTYADTTPQNTKAVVTLQRNETNLREYLKNKGMTKIITYNRTTRTPRSKILATTRKYGKMFTKANNLGGVNQSFLKSIQRTSPLNVLNEVSYESLILNTMTSSNANINKITKRWTTPNVTDITLQGSKSYNLMDKHRVTTSFPPTSSTPNSSKQIQTLKDNSTTSGVIPSTLYNHGTINKLTKRSTEPTTSANNGLRNITLTVSKTLQLPKIERFIEELDQKKNASKNNVIPSEQSKITSFNDSLVRVTLTQNTNEKDISYIEGTTRSLTSNIKANNHFDLQTSTEVSTSYIYFKKTYTQSHAATEYSIFNSNATIQKDISSTLQSAHNYIYTSISPRISTDVYSERNSPTLSFFKNITESEVDTTRGSIVNDILISDNKQTESIMSSNSKIYKNANLTALIITAPHSVQNITETDASPQIPTLLLPELIAFTSSYFTHDNTSNTKSIFRQLANDTKSRNNKTKSPTFQNSEKYTNFTTTEQTKTTILYTLRTNHEPLNLAKQSDKVTAINSVENFTESVVSRQIPNLLFSAPVTSTSSSFKNDIKSDSIPTYKEHYIKSRNQAKSLTISSEKHPKIHKTTEKTKTLIHYTPRSMETKNQIPSILAATTQKVKSDAKYKKSNRLKTNHLENITSGSLISQDQNKTNNLPNNETFTKNSFYEYTPFNVEGTKSNISTVPRITTSTQSSSFREKYFTADNKDYLFHTGMSSESKFNSPLLEQQMITAPLQNSNQISNKVTSEAIIIKPKPTEKEILSEQLNTNMSLDYYNNTQQVKSAGMTSVSDDFTISYDLPKVSYTPQLGLITKETPIPIITLDGQSDDISVGSESNFFTPNKKMKSKKKSTTLKLRSRNTIDLSALVKTPTVSKLKIAPAMDVVDYIRGHIELSSRQKLQQSATFTTTKTNKIEGYEVGKIRKYKNKTKKGSTVYFPSYFKPTKRTNRNYDNFFKKTQSANTIADVKVLFPNENYAKKGSEHKTSNKVNTVKISKDLFVKHTAKSTLPLPSQHKTGAQNDKNTFYCTSQTSVRRSKFQKIAAKVRKQSNITNIRTTETKMQTKPSTYKEENTLIGVFKSKSLKYPMSQGSEVLPMSEIALTTQPIQNNKMLSVEPHRTDDKVLDPTSNTSPRGRAPVTLIPTSTSKAFSLQINLKTITKGTPITRHEQILHSNITDTTQINKSHITTTTRDLDYNTANKNDKNGGKSVTSKKYSMELTTLTKTIKTVNSIRIKTFNLSVPTELSSFNERDRNDTMKSSEINTLPAIENLHLKQSQVNNISITNYLSGYKDIAKTVKLLLQNPTTSEHTLAIESSGLSEMKTKNVIMNNSEIKTFSYAVNEMKSTLISVPFVQPNSVALDSLKFTPKENNKKFEELTNKKNIFTTSIFTVKNEDHNVEKEYVKTFADHSEQVLSDDSLSYSKQNKSFDTLIGNKLSLPNTSRLIENSVTSPDLTKNTVKHDSNIQFNNLTKPVNVEDLEGTSKETQFTTQSYSLYPCTLSTYFINKTTEKLNSNDSVTANQTTSEKNDQFQLLEPNDAKSPIINVSNSKSISWRDNILRNNNIEKVHIAPSEKFDTLEYLNFPINSTAAVQTYTSKSNQQDAVYESYGSISKYFITSHPSNVSVDPVHHSIEIDNDSDAAKINNNINNTTLTHYIYGQLKTLEINDETVKDILDPILHENKELYEVTKNKLNDIEALVAEQDGLNPFTYKTTPINYVKHSAGNVESSAIHYETITNKKMPPDNDNWLVNDIVENLPNARSTDSMSRVSSPLLQKTQSLNSYDDNRPAQYTESLSLTLSSVTPPRVTPTEILSEIIANNNYNESLKNIAQTLSDLLLNSKNNNSIEKTIFTNDSKNCLNQTNTLCNGPLIIASNIILITNSENCGNQSKIKNKGNIRYPLIIITNSSNPSMEMNLDLNRGNKPILKMDPMTVYKVLFENAAKIVKEPNQYLRINNLSEAPMATINIGLDRDVNASRPNETRNDTEVELDSKTMQAIAQYIYETKNGRDGETLQSRDPMVAPASYTYNANPDRSQTNEDRSQTNEERSTNNELSRKKIVPDTDYSKKIFLNPTTDINDLSFNSHHEVLNKVKIAPVEFGIMHGAVPYNAHYFDTERNKKSENKIKGHSNDRTEQRESSRNKKLYKTDNVIPVNPLIDIPKSNDPYSVSKLSNLKSNFAKLSKPFKIVANKNDASPDLSAAVNVHPNMFYRHDKKPIQIKKTKQKSNVKLNVNRGVTTRIIMKHVTDTTKDDNVIKYNSYQPASHISDVSLDSNMQLLLSLNGNSNRKALSNSEISLFKKFNHQTADFKNIFKLGRKDENDDQYVLQYNQRYKTITEKLNKASTPGVERFTESGSSAHQVTKDVSNFTRKQRTFFTINTKDFFSQRRFYSKDVFRKDLTKARRVPFVLQYPATSRAAHVVLRPVFRNYGIVNLQQEQNVAAPSNAGKETRHYDNFLKEDAKSKLSLWQDKIVSFQNLLVDELKSNVLEKPAAAPPATERGVFDRHYNYNDVQAPAKIKKYYLKYLTGASNKVAKNLEVYRKNLDPKNLKDISTTESLSKRSRRTIFFLSPTVPYNRYF